MTRRHAAYKMSFEMLERLLNIKGRLYSVDTNMDSGVVYFRVSGNDLPRIPEGGYAIEMPLDDSVRERLKRYKEAANQ